MGEVVEVNVQTSPHMLARFLIARDFSPEKAFEQFQLAYVLFNPVTIISNGGRSTSPS